MRTTRRQKGLSLLEMLAVLALGALLGGAILALLDDDWERARLRADARQHALLAAATGRYLEAQRDGLVTGLATNVASVLPLSALRDAGYLAAGFAALNSRGQQACIVLLRSGAGALDTVEALVGASGGVAPPPADLAEMAAVAGPGAGAIGAEIPLRAQGAFGAWRIEPAALQPFLGAACPGGPLASGQLVSLLRQPLADQDAPAYLARRGAAADAPWNVMATPLGVGAGATATAGTACGADPALALDATRALLTCAGGQWRRQGAGDSWKDTRPRYSALPQDDRSGDVRMVADSDRAFVARGGGSWQALAVDQNGNLAVPRQAGARTLAVRGDLRVGNVDAVSGTLEVGAELRVGNNLVAQRNVSAHEVNVSGWSIAHAHFINLSANPAWAGRRCNLPGEKTTPYGQARGVLFPIGSMKHDGNGITMTCQAPWNEFRYMNGQMTP